jgi:hypothetical protein
LATIFRRLAEELRLQRKDVVEDAIDAPSFEAMVCDHTGPLQVPAQIDTERPVDARLSPNLCLFEQLQAPIECTLP